MKTFKCKNAFLQTDGNFACSKNAFDQCDFDPNPHKGPCWGNVTNCKRYNYVYAEANRRPVDPPKCKHGRSMGGGCDKCGRGRRCS